MPHLRESRGWFRCRNACFAALLWTAGANLAVATVDPGPCCEGSVCCGYGGATDEPCTLNVNVSGTVKDRATHLPVEGAEVAIEDADLPSTFTDVAGRYSLQGSTLSSCNIDYTLSFRAEAEGYIPHFTNQVTSAPQDFHLDFELFPERTPTPTASPGPDCEESFCCACDGDSGEPCTEVVKVSGTVADKATALPLAGVQVSIVESDVSGSTFSDAEGHYSIERAAPTTCRDDYTVLLEAIAAGYFPQSSGRTTSRPYDLHELNLNFSLTLVWTPTPTSTATATPTSTISPSATPTVESSSSGCSATPPSEGASVLLAMLGLLVLARRCPGRRS